MGWVASASAATTDQHGTENPTIITASGMTAAGGIAVLYRTDCIVLFPKRQFSPLG
jgi:hypothetical protein